MGKDYIGMFDMPDYIERNRERKKKLLRAVLYALIIISISSGVSLWWNTTNIAFSLIYGGAVFLCAWALTRLKKGREKVITSLLVFQMWLLFTILSYFRGEVNASLSLGYMVVMIIAMVTIDRWAGWLVVAASLLAYTLIPVVVNTYGSSSLVLPDSSSHQFFSRISLMILGAVLLDVTIQGINQLLRISRKYEQHYRALFERSNDVIFILDPDLGLIEMNQIGEVMLGYSQEELRNLSVENLVGDPETLEKTVKMLLAGDTVPIREDQLVTKPGEMLDVEISTSLVRDEKNRPLYLQCVARDVQEREKTKGKLIEYTQRYQAMFDSTVDAVFLLGLNGEQLDANQQAAKMLGYETFEEFKEKPISELFSPEDELTFQHVLDNLLAGKIVPNYDRTMVCKDGSRIIVEVSAGMVYDSEGAPLYVQTISRDVTEKRMREERLESSLAEMEILAMTDPLTKLLNRRAILEQARMHIEQAELHQSPFSVMLIDVDLLKNINDEYGHHAGDITLIYIAAQLDVGMRASDRVGRWGGDEFLIVMPRTGLQEAEIVARRLGDLIGQKDIQEECRAFRVGTSIGVAGTESDWRGVYDLNEILDMADKAMYMAKETGRHGVAVFQQTEVEK
jgi:diguanylate cyclase (GGDEF)-like protein/PAS domain S-box-containing protein